MKVSVHLRGGKNRTNMRSEALGRALEAKGHTVVYSDRKDPIRGSELVVQTGFAPSAALLDAIERRVPYIIMEAPFWRDFYDVDKASSWGYNGLAGGAWTPEPPEEERPKPELKPMKTGDKTLIIGQKPTDHSLRGSDHVEWIIRCRNNLPEADFRPHPLMVPNESQPSIKDALKGYSDVVVYTSTVGGEALVEGCRVEAHHSAAGLPDRESREEWLHARSWRQGAHSEFNTLISYVLSGYEYARDCAREGRCEIPRERVDGKAICERYYKLIGS